MVWSRPPSVRAVTLELALVLGTEDLGQYGIEHQSGRNTKTVRARWITQWYGRGRTERSRCDS